MRTLITASLIAASVPANAQQTFLFEQIKGFSVGSYTFTQEFYEPDGYREETTRTNFKGAGFLFQARNPFSDAPSIFAGLTGAEGNDVYAFEESLAGDDYRLSGFVYSISNLGMSISLTGKVRNGVLTYFSGTFGGGGQSGFTARFSTSGRISSNPGIPEPATWAMMIAGFAAVGAAVRRRPKLVVA